MRRRPQFSYANVMSTIAVFVALGGTSYAVARNSVGNAQLRANAVTSAKVRNGTLQSRDLSPAARQSVRGPRGPQGPAGPAAELPPLEPWKALPFIAGWADYSPGDVGYEHGAYRKDRDGQVHLRGLVTQPGGAPSTSRIIAVLPAGYRPAKREVFTSNGGNPDAYIRLDVLPDGTIERVIGPDAETDYTTLSGIAFWPT